MKKIKKAAISLVMTFAILMTTGMMPETNQVKAASLTDEQKNAIAMLNYITVLTQEINASKNSRLFMEEAYSSLINNTNPSAVDSRTLSQMTGLLDTMERYRMVNVKRDRLQYIYEQNQAQAVRAAVPNPMGLMSAVHSFRPSKLIASVVYMAVDSYTSYTAYTKESDLQYIKDGWALDDEEAATLHESRKGAYSYMVKIADDYDLPDELTLTENAVDEFVTWKNNDNIISRIQFLESNQKTYQTYGEYWLTLADSYYNNQDFEKCLDSISEYEALGSNIFRKDYEFAKILPLAIAAADEVYEEDDYIEYAARYAQEIVDNTDHDNWALRYFAAQCLVDLAGLSGDPEYLEAAYDLALDNVNYLVAEQRSMNASYLAPVQETSIPKDATKSEKEQIKNYNKMLKKERETALPPVYEPLQLNCDLLFAIAKELDIPESEQKKIDGVLHPNSENLFLCDSLDSLYWFNPAEEADDEDTFEIEYGGNGMILPVAGLTEGTTVTVTVKEADSDEETVFTDWEIDKVERGKSNDVGEFEVSFSSKEARKYSWKPGAAIVIDISPKEGIDLPGYHYEYKTNGTKKAWYDYLKVWEGHKNNWYDYAKVWENSVEFERVS